MSDLNVFTKAFEENFTLIQLKDAKIVELQKQEYELTKELNEINLSAQKLNSQFISLNSVYSESEKKEIQVSSNIHAIKLQIEKVKLNSDQLKRKTQTRVEIPKPIENENLEKELKNRREKKEKALNLINEMHSEGIKQIELIEKNSNDENNNLMQKIQYLSEKEIEYKENIRNVEQEFNDIKIKLEAEIQDFRKKSFSPDQEKILFLKNELEMISNQVESLEKETNEKRNKLDEMTTISTKLKTFLDEKNNMFQKEISNNVPIIDKQKEKIKKLNNLIQNKQRKNDKLASEIKDTQSESRKVDYLQLYKKEKIDLDEKYSQLHNVERKKQDEITKKLDKMNEQIELLKSICDDHQHSLNMLDKSKEKLNEEKEKMNKKNVKLVQLIKQANCELNGLKEMLKADELSTNDTKVLPVHVKTYIKLPESALNIEQAIKTNHKTLIDKINSIKLEYNQLVQKEVKVKNSIEKLKQENSNLKKMLTPYSKIRRFYKKYLIPKNSKSGQISIQTQQATISAPKLTLECQRIDIH